MQLRWSKSPTGGAMCKIGPLAIRIEPKPDGRFSWQIVNGEARSPMAAGITNSLGAAKNLTEQFVKRSDLV